MMVIPQEEYLHLTTLQRIKQPLVEQFKKLENDYEQQEHISDPHRKLVHQSETLDAMKEIKEKMRHQIVTAAPKPYQSRTRSLLQHLEPILKLNERGEIFDRDQKLIEHSNIEDLIQFAVRDRRRTNFTPTGWNAFVSLLKRHNVPTFMLNRYTLDELEGALKKIKAEPRPTNLPLPKITPPRRQSPKDTKQRPRRKAATDIDYTFIRKF